MSKLQKFRALSWPERRMLVKCMAWQPLFWAGLRFGGLARMRRWIDRSAPRAGRTRLPFDAARLGRLVQIAANSSPFPSTCLSRSLLLVWLLGRRGQRAELRIGVRRVEGAIESHAWVEFAGAPVNDAPDVAEHFAAFDAPLPSGSGKLL